jgi:transcriptional antiterminator RfaH
MHWYVIHTKPRQEQRALQNLQQQGFTCFLPLLARQKLCRGTLTVVLEPLFARYLFIQLDGGQMGQSWAPIRSTQGVSRLVTFGTEPAKVSDELIDALRAHGSTPTQAEPLFTPGERVQIKDGPFAGLEAIYQLDDGERRAMVLIELLHKPSRITLAPASLRKI